MIIEICANSFASAKAAQNAGAHRIELCTQLSVGGLTPSHGLIAKIIEELEIPIHVLIRPRAGDFVYSLAELDIMKRDIAYCKEIGCEGIVTGVLTENNELDYGATKELMKAAQGMEFTFHRAFDLVANASKTLKELERLEVTRILSSGQRPKAIEGMGLLKIMKDISEKVQIMPGSGINETNALAFKEAGFEMLHFSASKSIAIPKNTTAVSFNDGAEGVSDEVQIRNIISMLDTSLS